MRHAPVFTVAESRALRGALPGGHSKNLFLRPAKGGDGPFLLAVLEESRKVSVNALARDAGAGRVEMAPAEALRAVLGVEPGSVTPFGLVNAAPGAVRTVVDAGLLRDHEWVHFHPLVNSMTTAIRPAACCASWRAWARRAAGIAWQLHADGPLPPPPAGACLAAANAHLSHRS